MTPLKIIRQRLEHAVRSVHKARREAVWTAVASLLIGGQLWLTALGRTRPGSATDKSSIKALDRLLGNSFLYNELKIFYSGVCQTLLGNYYRPIVLVDITEARTGFCAITASLATDGRGLLIFSIVRKKSYVYTRACKQAFLSGLKGVLPEHVQPTLVTDAGFESPWFDQVEAMGWDYVGRVRHRTKFLDGDGNWVDAKALHKRATRRARNLGSLAFPRSRPKQRRLVLAKRPNSKGRKRINTKGKPGRRTNDRRCQESAREPWLLATSLQSAPEHLVEIYALRMQIEQNFRDAKNHRWGWALDQSRSRTHERLEVLLLLATLGMIVQQGVGCAGECKGLAPRFQANTVRGRRVISLFVLGRLLLTPKNHRLLDTRDILLGFEVLFQKIRTVT